MKKLLALTPAFAVLAACTSAPIAAPTPAQVQAVQANSQVFKCDQGAEVTTLYTERDGTNYANVKITAPNLTLNQAALVLKQDVSASGERFVLTNPGSNTTYEWHVKGTEGVLAVTTQGREFTYSCNAI